MRCQRLIPGIVVLAVVFACRPCTAAEPAIQPPATIGDDPAVLVQTKAALASGSGPSDALERLTKDADHALKKRAGSVMDKPSAGPSGDKHDYVSFAPYYWPNPNTSSGLPYVRRDGYHNEKQVALGDSPEYESMQNAVHTLGLAYWYTGKQEYAQQAAKLVRTWFLDPATRMNPNFKYSEATLGSTQGRGAGLIQNRALVEMLDGIALLKGSGAWTDADESAMQSWVKQYDSWMRTSKEGKSEQAEANNHGSWYAVQEAELYFYLHKSDDARKVLDGIKDRIAKQVEPDGRQPLEAARADGYSYSVFNLTALMILADLGKRNGVDLWNYQKDGRSIKSTLDYLMPFAAGQKPWPKSQLTKISPDSLAPLVARAAEIYQDPRYAQWLKDNATTKMSIGDLSGD